MNSFKKDHDSILQIIQYSQFQNLSYQTVKGIIKILDIDPNIDDTTLIRSSIAIKIIQLYSRYKNYINEYLSQSQYIQIRPESKQFIQRVYHFYLAKKTAQNNIQSQATNNILPAFSNVDEVQNFQIKLYEIYRAYIPQILIHYNMFPTLMQQYYNSNNQQRATYSQPFITQGRNKLGEMQIETKLNDKVKQIQEPINPIDMAANIYQIAKKKSGQKDSLQDFQEDNLVHSCKKHKIKKDINSQQRKFKMLSRHQHNQNKVQRQHQQLSKNLSKIKPIEEPSDKCIDADYLCCRCQGSKFSQDNIKCCKCLNLYHLECMKIQKSISQNFVCFICQIRNIDYFHQVKQDLGHYYMENISQKAFSTQIKFNKVKQLIKDLSIYDIEIRCGKINGLSCIQNTWPDNAVVRINGNDIIQHKALLSKVSLKKRKDNSLLIGKYLNNNYEILELQIFIKKYSEAQQIKQRINNNCSFLIGVYLVKKHQLSSLYQQIMSNIQEHSQHNFIKNLMNNAESDIQLQKVKISLLDPYSKNIIQIPVRGNLCHHGQCFDLYVFLSFMEISVTRLWKCPICSNFCRHFIIDFQQQELLEKFKKQSNYPQQVWFNRNGQIEFIWKGEQKKISDTNKTKSIRKNSKQQHSIKDDNIKDDNIKDDSNKADNIEQINQDRQQNIKDSIIDRSINQSLLNIQENN